MGPAATPAGPLESADGGLAALHETAQALTSTLQLAAVLETIADRVLGLIRVDDCAVFELDPVDGCLHRRATRGKLGNEADPVIRPGQGIAGTAVSRQQVICSPDVERQPPAMFVEPWSEAGETMVEAVRRRGIRAILAVPLVSRGTTLGAVCLYWVEPHACDEREMRLLIGLTQYAAIAIENARLHAEMLAERREADFLSEVTRDLSSSLDLASLLRKIIEYARERCDSDMAFIAPYDRARGVATIVASVGARTDVYVGVGIPPGKGIGGKVLESRQPFVTSDYLNDPRFTHDYNPLAEREGFVANMAVPILRESEILGVLWVVNRGPRQFTAHHQALLTKLAGHAAIAVHNARLFEETRRQLGETAALLEIARASTSTLELKPLLKAIARHTARALDAERCTIDLLRDGHLVPVMSQYADGHHDPAVWAKFRRLLGRPMAENSASVQAMRLRRPVLVEDARASDLLAPDWVDLFGLRSVLIAPLIVKDEVIGTLTVDDTRGPRHWSAAEVDLAMTLAAQVALSVENARLYDESQRARALLEGKNAELDAFAYSVSHDLKAPLVTIQGMAGLLLDEYGSELPGEAARYLERIQVNAQQTERLIVDLLELSRIGREARAPVAVSLAEVTDEVAADLGPAIRERGIEMVRGELPTLWGVRTQIDQVMRNLLGNAVKYLGDTTAGRVEVGAVDRGAFVECYVRDNGIGIDPAYHERIFEVFQRLKDVEVEGTGVGLAIVKKIVQSNRGRVWVESAKGQGATFRFTWPRRYTSARHGLGGAVKATPAASSGSVPAA